MQEVPNGIAYRFSVTIIVIPYRQIVAGLLVLQERVVFPILTFVNSPSPLTFSARAGAIPQLLIWAGWGVAAALRPPVLRPV